MRTTGWVLLVGALVVGWSAAVRAEEIAAPEAAAPEAEVVVEAAAAKPAKAPKDKGTLEIDGRIFVRETASDDTGEWTSQSSLRSVRMGLDYRWKDLKARVSVEFRKSARLRNTYLQLEPREGLEVRAGYFKLPVSPIEMTSSWDLPMVDRGLISIILKDRLQVAGRRLGTQVAWSPGDCYWLPRARAGYWQGLDDLENPLLGEAEDYFGKVGAARVESGPFGASGELRSGKLSLTSPIRQAWAAGVDATVEWMGLRTWAEAIAGSSWLVNGAGRDTATFIEGRGVFAYRLGGVKKNDPYVEPYALVGLMDPDVKLADDRIFEVSGGVNAGRWKRWRGQAELQVWRLGKNAPNGIVTPVTAPRDRTAIIFQLAAAF